MGPNLSLSLSLSICLFFSSPLSLLVPDRGVVHFLLSKIMTMLIFLTREEFFKLTCNQTGPRVFRRAGRDERRGRRRRLEILHLWAHDSNGGILSVTPWHSSWHTVPRKKFVALRCTRLFEDYYYLTKQSEQLTFEPRRDFFERWFMWKSWAWFDLLTGLLTGSFNFEIIFIEINVEIAGVNWIATEHF